MARKPKIVEAVGAAVGQMGGAKRATAIQDAMTAAIVSANAKGITDPEKVRELVQQALLRARDA